VTDPPGPGRADRVQFLGHATLAVVLDGVTILTDPVLRDRLAHLRRHRAVPRAVWPAAVDAVVISHIHQDHLDFRSLRLLGHQVHLIVPRGAGRLLWQHGFRNAQELGVGETVQIGAVRVRATPAVHSGFRPPFGPRAECLGFIFEGRERVYFAGDTDLYPEMGALGPIDVALLPVWGWGPWLGPGHLDPARAAEAVARIRPTVAIPIHWGTLYPFGLGPWSRGFLTRPPRAFAALARAAAPGADVRIVAPGQSLGLLE